MFWTLLLVACAGAGAAPSEVASSALLPKEHREDRTLEHLDATVEALLNSKTAQALDTAAAGVANLMGDVIENLGDMVVESVQELPKVLQRLNETVDHAMIKPGERVMIMVRGVLPGGPEAAEKQGVEEQENAWSPFGNWNNVPMSLNITTTFQHSLESAVNESTVIHNITTTLDRFGSAINESKVVHSLNKLGESITTSVATVFASLFGQLEKIDKVVAEGISGLTKIVDDTRESLNTDVDVAPNLAPEDLPLQATEDLPLQAPEEDPVEALPPADTDENELFLILT